jgi:hypothetical protein
VSVSSGYLDEFTKNQECGGCACKPDSPETIATSQLVLGSSCLVNRSPSAALDQKSVSPVDAIPTPALLRRVNCPVLTLTVLGPKEAEMRITGCDLHARQQTLVILDTITGEVVKMNLAREDNNARDIYFRLPRPVRVRIEATGSMQWFVNLMEALGIECRVGHVAEIRAALPRKQKLTGAMRI